MRQKKPVTAEDIRRGLTSIGIEKGDSVFAHSSLSSFGYVKGGADTVIDALLEMVGDSGTLVMPAFTWEGFHDKQNIIFDLVNTPSEVGRITEVFRKREGVMRSTHICHSVAAIGTQAQYVMGEGIKSFGKGSSFERLYQLNSWNLFLGVSFSVCTALHMVEEFMQVPYREYRDFKGSQVILPQGTEMPSKSVEYLPKEGYHNDFEKMEEVLSHENLLYICQIGDAKIINVRIRDIFEVTKRYMEQDIGFLLTPQSKKQLHQAINEELKGGG